MGAITLELPDHWVSFIEAQVRSGRHAEARWVVAEALGLLEYEVEHDELAALSPARKAELRREFDAACVAAVTEGLSDLEAGRHVVVDDIDAFMDDLGRTERAA
jgi:Arc/MetJ-type ribon-helix-helix transcriptional regulator